MPRRKRKWNLGSGDTDWKNPEEHKAYMRNRWRKIREWWFSRIAFNRKCPIHGEVVLSSMSWVFFRLDMIPDELEVKKIMPNFHGWSGCCKSCCARFLRSCVYGKAGSQRGKMLEDYIALQGELSK